MDFFLKQVISSQKLDRKIAKECIDILREQIKQIVIGQDEVVDQVVLCFLMGEHCLLEGLPGLAKTQLAKSLAQLSGLEFQRAQFVPDMMPQDLLYRETIDSSNKMGLRPIFGKVFTNIMVADEINRAPSKVQAALLEVCSEKEVSIITKSKTLAARPAIERLYDENEDPEGCRHEHVELEKKLSKIYFQVLDPNDLRKQLNQFMVVATMNPIEQEGVYPLSEAQMDRFAMRLQIRQPNQTDYGKISEQLFQSGHCGANPLDDKEVAKRHFHCLYFLTWLQTEKLFTESAHEKWRSNPLKAIIEHFIDFTHLQKPLFSGQNSARFGNKNTDENKQLLLNAQLKTWLKSDNHKYQQVAKNILTYLEDDNYPEVYSGASPRGLLKLIKAIHVKAFLNGEEPSFHHLKHIANYILNHRVKIVATRYGEADTSEFIERLLACFEPLSEDT
ncbi:AAA family ATPase [Pseudoalteromonas luteoviolacea]|uniref:AAA+ ATPase domain-containing protein n=1 Tax=Pseudoalteromonas luteoviolacea S4054 TaxID=1129367 RepID=A0A0F6A7H4_9GAMM|nr:AAA family ATPase [Pseudoalteromonas luteoviolacea]AOT10701.1 hypothetical protein S4054249_22865 [Pseudoalteromonas luteoviolacea]AOT16137.1 hypothetical protein S40542_25645 [Pseudoalteromonas luteoviolacea]AOT20521.1 hypothetical protein S4054_22780 [Pseudoalteromonas luteoviolacea]KKE82073.1 hypothetical protein N479_20190 [Pseudoalteromonas luteoviolacea S4054]KZN67708.1 hypothetical protein N481_23725 [Pseudoalteromonas luteoviolacea S4047-1]